MARTINSKITPEMLQRYKEFLENDYMALQRDKYKSFNPEKFQISFEPGLKFIRVVSKVWDQRLSHSFIVNEDTKDGFKVGDILKCASWKQPARNFTRGSVLTGDYQRCRWTGCL